MAEEEKRGCGFRKVGGLYLVGDGIGLGCNLLPLKLEVCPCCSAGIKYSRGWKWIVPKMMFPEKCDDKKCIIQKQCPLQSENPAGLMWIGEKFYTPESFIQEAMEMGISKRIGAVPRNFEIGKTWVFLAHIKAVKRGSEEVPGIFYVFKPSRIEKIVTETQAKDEKEMKLLTDRNIVPVVVPDNDKDHQGSVYDTKAHQKSLFED